MKPGMMKSGAILSAVILAMSARYMMIEGVSNRVGVIKVLILGCSGAMTRCLRTRHGNQGLQY